ncbi:MAG TPA: hypothetical protein VFE90_20330, partial [Myxococcales bacterium]|nr:hypothetical protein [Myxococcales bacterium]
MVACGKGTSAGPDTPFPDAGGVSSADAGPVPGAENAAVLIIDANGGIAEASHITVNGGHKVGDNVSGAPILIDDISGTFDTITITNRSSEELRVGGISAASAALVLAISNEGASDVVLGGVIDNPIGSTTIRDATGDIRSVGSSTVRSNRLTLAAHALGSVSNRLVIELVRSSGQDCDLSAQASSDLFLELTGQLHGLSATDAAFASSEIAAGGAADLLLHAADLSGPIASTYQFQHLAGANVVVIAPSAAAADAKTNLIANTDLLGLGQVDVLTNGDIGIVETAGDLRVGTIQSTAGDVSLATSGASGSILDTNPAGGTVPSVIGNGVQLSAANGAVGVLDNALEIDSSHQAPGRVRVVARDGVFVTETQGDLNLDAVASQHSDVLLATLSGSMLDAAADVQAEIQGANIDLIAKGGGIGTDG